MISAESSTKRKNEEVGIIPSKVLGVRMTIFVHQLSTNRRWFTQFNKAPETV